MGKRGRPRKRPVEEVKEENAEGGDVAMLHPPPSLLLPMTPQQGILSAEVALVSGFKYFTRGAKEAIKQCTARSTPLRFPIRNVNGPAPLWSPIQNVNGMVTNSLVEGQDIPISVRDIPASKFSPDFLQTQGLISSASLMCSTPDSHALPNMVKNQNISVLSKFEVKSVATDHDLLNTKKNTDDLLAENNGPGVVCPVAPSVSEIVSDNYQPLREANVPLNDADHIRNAMASKSNQSGARSSRAASLNLTQMIALMGDESLDTEEVGSRPAEALVLLNGYQVKEELVPIAMDILTKYGDIAKDGTFRSDKCRSCVLEIVCGIYQNLEASNFMGITSKDLSDLLDQVKDLEILKVEVTWLRHRLDEIFEVKRLFQSLKEDKTRNIQVTESRRKVLDGCKKELQAVMVRIKQEEVALTQAEAEAETINEKFISVKSKVKTFYRKSLVYGLL